MGRFLSEIEGGASDPGSLSLSLSIQGFAALRTRGARLGTEVSDPSLANMYACIYIYIYIYIYV